MKRITQRSILIIITLILMASSVFTVILYQKKISKRFDKETEQVLQDSAAEQAKIFDSMLDGIYQDLLIVSNAAVRPQEKLTEDVIPELQQLINSTNLDALIVATPDGTAYTSENTVLNISRQQFFIDCMAGTRTICKLGADLNNGQSKFAIGIPVAKNGKIFAAVIGYYDAEGFVNKLISTAFGDLSYSFVCSSQGDIVIPSNHSSYIINKDNLFDFLLSSGSLSADELGMLKESISSGKSGFIEYGMDGQNRYAAYQPLGINNWWIFNAVPGNVIDEKTTQTTQMGILMVSLITVISLMFMFLIAIITYRSSQRLEEEYKIIQANDERLRIALKYTSLTIWDYDINQGQIIQSDASLKQHGFDTIVDNVPNGLVASGYVHPDSVEAFLRLYHDINSGVPHAEGIFRVQTANRDGWWYEHVQYENLFDKHGKPYLAIGFSQDVTQQQQFQKAAQVDSLTGIFNHNTTIHKIRQMLSYADSGQTQALFVIDLDSFKTVNDTRGHQVGDTALAKVAEVLKGSFRSHDVVGRVGGDEFLAFLTDAPDHRAVVTKAELLIRRLRIKVNVDEQLTSLSSSVGVAIYLPGESFESLYKRADAALYTAKSRGKNGYYIDNPQDS